MVSPLDQIAAISRLSNEEHFVNDLFDHFQNEASQCYLTLTTSKDRLLLAHKGWKDGTNAAKIQAGRDLDQYEIAGFLCYWILRANPIIHLTEDRRVTRISAGNNVLEALGSEQEFLYQFSNEFFAFDAGVRICRSVEVWRLIEDNRPRKYGVPRHDLTTSMCEFLQNSAASPQTLQMIYRTMFES